MPELPEVETTLRGISPHISNKLITKVQVRRPKLRWPIPDNLAELLTNQRVISTSRRGKYLLIGVKHGTVLYHLGMSGSLRIINDDTQPLKKHDHVILHFKGIQLRLNDPRRFGAVLWTGDDPYTHPLLRDLGPEPLEDEFDAKYLYDNCRTHKQAIKTWIMNSKCVVGVGNIYASEALFRTGIHPLKAACKITKAESSKLVSNIKGVLAQAIERGGTTLRDFVNSDGKPGYFAQELEVYGRGGEPCKKCNKPLTEKKIAQRSTVYCTKCQK
ncbi:MAG: DNA-formamidopyrimidine glycosylase [Alteromonadaceae bacterium]|nr:MAG: DNA-formamidopyrimidine glycosylase [Alteromonadaceae bacterium]